MKEIEERSDFGAGAETAWLSWLRVFAICGVMAIHTLGVNAVEDGARHSLRGWVAIVLDAGSNYTVPVFVMASGAMLLDPRRFTTTGEFLRKRVLRLVPAILFWNLAYAIFVEVTLGQHLSVKEAVGRSLAGTLYTHLYFFWIVLGLSLIAPVFISFVKDSSRMAVILLGVGLCAVPALSLATRGLRHNGASFDGNAFTWWVPYLGFFVLGYALRGIVLRRWALWASVAVALGMVALNAWRWQNPDAARLDRLSPLGYYSATGAVFAIAVYLAFQGLIATEGPLRVLCRPAPVRLGRLLGDATLGVYALHFMILVGAHHLRIGGPKGAPAPTTHDELLRLTVVIAASWAAVLLLRRVPLLSRVM